jgi:catechol 2,3-dioxygenase-like lactoylglutathione lyase family enzyme
MKITLTSVLVKDQSKALEFYTKILGFVKKTDIPLGEASWLTVASPEGHDDVELLLEPMGFAPARTYQAALYEAGIPAAMFAVDDINKEHARLDGLGVQFRSKPAEAGPAIVATFDDTCGNLIQIVQKK